MTHLCNPYDSTIFNMYVKQVYMYGCGKYFKTYVTGDLNAYVSISGVLHLELQNHTYNIFY